MADRPSGDDARVVVGLPESLGRRMRLGPFPSSRHALKFAAYAAIGGSVAAVLGVAWSIPFLGVGFLLSVYRGEGRGLDEHFGGFLSFCWRVRPRAARPAGTAASSTTDGPYLTEVPGHLVGILAVAGIPIAFLPPADARSLFLGYRELLRSVDRGFVLQMGVEPLHERPFLPIGGRPDTGRPDEIARRGYAEMVSLLCRRRYRRRVLIAASEPAAPDAALRLEASIQRLEDGLARLGLSAGRLRGDALRGAAARIGWRGREAG